jgi:hypothetical protein
MHFQRAEQLRGEGIEVEGAAAVGAGAGVVGARGRERFEAVDAYAREIAGQAAHRDGAALALVTIDGDAGDTLQRLGEIRVREIRDVVGVDGIHHDAGFTLGFDGAAQGGAISGDGDFLHLVGSRGLLGDCRIVDEQDCRSQQTRMNAADSGAAKLSTHVCVPSR